MAIRSNLGYQTFIYQLARDVLVVCPVCSGCATVKANGFPFPRNQYDEIKIVCTQCGFNKVLPRNPTVLVNAGRVPSKRTEGKHLIFGVPIDPFFHLSLWITANVRGNLLWAYNYEHLKFLRQFVEAELRERNGVKSTNGSIGSRLPKWMTSRKNRKDVLRVLEKLLTV